MRRRLRGFIFVCIGIAALSFLTLATYFKFLSKLAIEISAMIPAYEKLHPNFRLTDGYVCTG